MINASVLLTNQLFMDGIVLIYIHIDNILEITLDLVDNLA